MKTLVVITLLALATPAAARPVTLPVFGSDVTADAVLPSFTLAAAASLPTLDDAQQTVVRRPVAVEYSDAYKLRAKIPKYASFATLPLFAAEIALGQSLYNNTTFIRGDSKRGAHGAVGSAIGILFAANTVTGVWNLWDGRHDPNGRTKRWVHGLLMLVADAGFVATAAAVPNRESFSGLFNYETDKATHRRLAFGSMGVATVAYTMMLFGGR
jgi:hypothetical protein